MEERKRRDCLNYENTKKLKEQIKDKMDKNESYQKNEEESEQ